MKYPNYGIFKFVVNSNICGHVVRHRSVVNGIQNKPIYKKSCRTLGQHTRFVCQTKLWSFSLTSALEEKKTMHAAIQLMNKFSLMMILL